MAAILIAGCGDVGGELARRLLADGHEVCGLRRRTHLLPAGVQPVAGDVRDPDSLRGLPGGLDVLCYTAAADGRSAAAYRAAYVDGVRNMLQAVARTRSLRRVLYTSGETFLGEVLLDGGIELPALGRQADAGQPIEFFRQGGFYRLTPISVSLLRHQGVDTVKQRSVECQCDLGFRHWSE